MMDAKARQDCIKEIDLLKVGVWTVHVYVCNMTTSLLDSNHGKEKNIDGTSYGISDGKSNSYISIFYFLTYNVLCYAIKLFV